MNTQNTPQKCNGHAAHELTNENGHAAHEFTHENG